MSSWSTEVRYFVSWGAFYFLHLKMTGFGCRMAHEMLKHLNLVWLLYFLEKCYILHIRCSTEVWRIVSSARCLQCGHHAAETSSMTACAFAITLEHDVSRIVRQSWTFGSLSSNYLLGFLTNSFSFTKVAVKWPGMSTLVALWNAVRHYCVAEHFMKEIVDHIDLRGLALSCIDHCICFGVPSKELRH